MQTIIRNWFNISVYYEKDFVLSFTENVASMTPKIIRINPASWVISGTVTLTWNSSLTPSSALFLDILAYQVCQC